MSEQNPHQAKPAAGFNFDCLPQWMVTHLNSNQITQPTEIQQASMPHILEGKDVLATASTGSGKTIAYLAPIITHLSKSKQRALVIVPTRELAKQIEHEAKQLLGKKSPLDAVALIGGAPFHLQKKLLRKSPNIVIGTPGRIIDHLQRQNLHLDSLTHLVLDETDRLLDQGFMPQVNEIRDYIDHHPQTIMLSATLPKPKLAEIKSLLRSPEEIHIGKVNQPKANIKVSNQSLKGKEKFKALKAIIGDDFKTNVIFVNTKRHVETISEKLTMDQIPNCMLHGDIPHRKRQRIIRQFREGQTPTLVATDVAARGIDIVHIERVINYDLPQAPEDYIHRIGRSARGNAKGEAINFITDEDKIKWQNIQNFIAGKKTTPEQKSKFRGGKKGGFWSKSKHSDGDNKERRFNKSRDWHKSHKSDGDNKERSFGKSRDWHKSKKTGSDKRERSFDKAHDRTKSKKNGNFKDKPFNRANDQSKSKRSNKPFNRDSAARKQTA